MQDLIIFCNANNKPFHILRVELWLRSFHYFKLFLFASIFALHQHPRFQDIMALFDTSHGSIGFLFWAVLHILQGGRIVCNKVMLESSI